MTIQNVVAERLISELQPIRTKAILMHLVRNHKVNDSDILDSLVKHDVIRIVNKPIGEVKDEIRQSE